MGMLRRAEAWSQLGLFSVLVGVLVLGLGGCMSRSVSSIATSSGGAAREPVQLRSLGPWLGASGRGMGVVSFELENLEQREHSGAVQLATDNYRLELNQTVPFQLAPGEKRRIDVRFPAFAISDGDVSLSLFTDGASGAGFQQVAALGHVRGATTRVLVIENRRRAAGWNTDRGAALDKAMRIPLQPGGAVVKPVLSPISAHVHGAVALGYILTPTATPGVLSHAVGRIAPTELLPDADAMQGYDAIVLDRSSEPPGAETVAALEVFARRGGNLVLAGGGDVRWTPDWLERYEPERFAFASGMLPEPARRAGLGLVVLSDFLPLEDDAQLSTLVSLLDQLPARLPEGTESYGSLRPSSFPGVGLVGMLASDPRLMCLVVLGIVILLGPVVLLFVRRSGRPALLLVAVPIASLVTTMLVVGYGLLKDGVGLKAAINQTVLLDQRSQVASTHEGRVYFAGPMVRSQLRPGAGTLVSPTPEAPHRRYSQRWNYGVDDTEGLVLSGDLFPKRKERQLVLVTDRSTRARLEVDFSGAAPRVANALGSNLESLRLLDAAGDAWHLPGSLAAGASGTLERGTASATPYAVEDFDLDGLIPGSYEALLDELLALDDLGQPKFELQYQRTRVMGILDLGGLGSGAPGSGSAESVNQDGSAVGSEQR